MVTKYKRTVESLNFARYLISRISRILKKREIKYRENFVFANSPYIKYCEGGENAKLNPAK